MNSVLAYRLGDDGIDAAAFDGRRFAAHPRHAPLAVRLTMGGRWEPTGSTSSATLPNIGALLGNDRLPEYLRVRGLRRDGDRLMLGRHEASLLDVLERAFRSYAAETGWSEARRIFVTVSGAAERVEAVNQLIERLDGPDRVVLVDTADAHLSAVRRTSLGKAHNVLVVEVAGVDTRLTLFGREDGVQTPLARRTIADHGEISLRARLVEQLADCYAIPLEEEGRRALLETTMEDFESSPLQAIELPLVAEQLGSSATRGPLVLHQEEVEAVTGRYLRALRLAAASLASTTHRIDGVLIAGGAMARDRKLVAALTEASGAPVHVTQASPALAAALVPAPRHLASTERRSLARPLSSLPPRRRSAPPGVRPSRPVESGLRPSSGGMPQIPATPAVPQFEFAPKTPDESALPPPQLDSDQLAGRAGKPSRSGTMPKIVPGEPPPSKGEFRNPVQPHDWIGLSLRDDEPRRGRHSVATLLFWLVRSRATGQLALHGMDGSSARVGVVAGRLWMKPAQRVAIQDVFRAANGHYTFDDGKAGAYEGSVRASSREIVVEAIRRQSWAWDDDIVDQALEHFRPLVPFLRMEVSQLDKLGLTPVEERFLLKFDSVASFGELAERQEAVGARGLIFLCLVLSVFEIARWRQIRDGKRRSVIPGSGER